VKAGKILRLGSDDAMDWKVNLGIAVLGMLLLISVMAVVVFLMVPLLVSRAAGTQPGLVLLYFVAIGLGYILVEVTFIQRFVLFLGHPTYALTVVIFLMLLSSGAGSVVSRSCLSHSRQVGAVGGDFSSSNHLRGVARLLTTSFARHFQRSSGSAALWRPSDFVGHAFPNRPPSSVRKRVDRRLKPTPIEWAWAMGGIQRFGLGAGDCHCHSV
jgi:hypothetical protein